MGMVASLLVPRMNVLYYYAQQSCYVQYACSVGDTKCFLFCSFSYFLSCRDRVGVIPCARVIVEDQIFGGDEARITGGGRRRGGKEKREKKERRKNEEKGKDSFHIG
jgi:hypothetical protein